MAEKDYEWYIGNWEAVSDPESIYIKIDDDVVSPILLVQMMSSFLGEDVHGAESS